ncbi:hypothetical protein D3C71_1558270 [compost metagenome]
MGVARIGKASCSCTASEFDEIAGGSGQGGWWKGTVGGVQLCPNPPRDYIQSLAHGVHRSQALAEQLQGLLGACLDLGFSLGGMGMQQNDIANDFLGFGTGINVVIDVQNAHGRQSPATVFQQGLGRVRLQVTVQTGDYDVVELSQTFIQGSILLTKQFHIV